LVISIVSPLLCGSPAPIHFLYYHPKADSVDPARVGKPEGGEEPMTDLETTERPLSRDYSAIAERLAADCAREAAELDRDETFVAGNYEKAKAAGLIDAGVPAELGGGGADVRALCDILRRLAHGCSSTALALSMHTHQVAFPAWRWHHQQATRDKTEPLLRRIAAEKLVLLSSGGGDWIGGSGKAAPVEGGYRIIARKMFVSGAPAGDILMTSAISPEDGGTIIHFPCPMSAPEVSILDTWHTLGMRATGSHDVMIDGLFVPAEKVAVKRPQGRWHPLFFMLGTIAFPLIYAVYLGIAERARDLAVGFASARPASPRLRDRAGRMDTALTVARLAHADMIAAVELNAPSAETVNRVMTGRRLVEENAIRTVELALELAGGPGFYRKAELERLFRDIQAARYHPLQKEVQAEFAGALALGQPIDEIF
jgi:alkylation response protein AidB-like acyl-CoA dehydrogenase